MDTFIVSARKYRPQNFSTVVGQSHITTTLKNAINHNQLAHAFLFCGPRGVGKTTCARILAKTINCENRTPDGEACNQCNSCVSFDAGTSLNIHELDAASNNSVDDIRALVEQVRFAPQAGKYKVYIVDEVHMLSASAFNAFLKTLEEPPPYAIFILATTEKHKILPTILSRCQIFDFKRITTADTVAHLQEICDKEAIRAEKPALHVIAQKSEGCMRDSLSILDKIVSFTNGQVTYSNTLEHLNILDEDYYFRLQEHLYKQELSSALLMYDEINQKGFEGDTVLNGFAEFLRNLLVSSDARVALLLEVAEDFRQKYIQAAAKVPAAWIVSALNILNEAEIGFKQARNKRLHVELTLIRLSYLGQALELVGEGTSLSKKKITEGSKTLSFRALPIYKAAVPAGDPVPESASAAPAPSAPPTGGGARLLIETPAVPAAAPAPNPPAAAITEFDETAGRGLAALRRQRQQGVPQESREAPPRPVTEPDLMKAWTSLLENLRRNNGNPAVLSNLSDARPQVNDDQTVGILTASEFQKKFVESQRAVIIEHLQQWFNNRTLTYRVLVDEKTKNTPAPEQTLTRRQQYQKIAEAYPLVRELKERLKLELE